MARKDPDINWMPVKAASYPTIQALIENGQLKQVHTYCCGPKEKQTFGILKASTVNVISDQSIQIAGMPLIVDLFRQPTHTYRAMVEASPEFTQYPDMDKLFNLIRQRPYWNQQEVVEELQRLVKEGRQRLTEPQLVVTPTTYQAIWNPAETFLRQNPNGHWFLGLTYRVTYRPAQQALQKVRVGLDLGMNPLTAAYTSSGEGKLFEPTDIAPTSRLVESGRLPQSQRELLTQLLYSSGREDAEKVVAWLNYHASQVTVEKLTHNGMTRRFVYVGRDQAIHDHHFSALSQYLNASQILFNRIDPAGTSRECAYCLERTGKVVVGNRWRDVFTCPVCGTVRNAHENAAHNVLLRGHRSDGLSNGERVD